VKNGKTISLISVFIFARFTLFNECFKHEIRIGIPMPRSAQLRSEERTFFALPPTHINFMRRNVSVCSVARLEDVTLHTLRHTFASIAGDLGFSELTIAALLGHGRHPALCPYRRGT
jgi:hypothetical protein